MISPIEGAMDTEIEIHEEAVNANREQKLIEIRARIVEAWTEYGEELAA